MPGHEKKPIELPDRMTEYRHGVAVARFLRNYRPGLGYTVKELSHSLQRPTEADWERLRRLARCLQCSMDVGVHLRWPTESMVVRVFIDTDWAGDKLSRKSTEQLRDMREGLLDVRRCARPVSVAAVVG